MFCMPLMSLSNDWSDMGNSQREAFVRAVELGSLTAAADDLGYTHSGVTHLLNALEGRLGMRHLQEE